MLNKVGRIKSKMRLFLERNSIVYLNSFPKSGNTWARFLLAQYFMGRKVTFPEIRYVIPAESMIGAKMDKAEILQQEPMILKSHSLYKVQYKKVIYLFRDPRDVVVSFFHFEKLQKSISEDLDFATYINHQINAADGHLAKWKEHIHSYQNCSAKTLFLSYEEMLADTEAALIKILEFLEVPVELPKVEQAVLSSSFKNLKQNNNSPFFRKGIKGDWKNYFSEETEELIWNKYGEEISKLGYDRH